MKYATLWYVTPPTDEQLARLKAFLAKEMGDDNFFDKLFSIVMGGTI